MKRQKRKVNVYRLILVLSVILILCSAIGQVFASAFNANMTTSAAAHVIVKSGDTLWSIATRYTTPNEDIREVIYEIQKVNHLSPNASIIPGQTITIPVVRQNNLFRLF